MNTQPTTALIQFTTLINYAQKVWAGEIPGEYCETYLNAQLSSFNAQLEQLTQNMIQPYRIIGSGYENPRKVAFEYLHNRIAEYTDYISRKEIHHVTIANYFFKMAKICTEQGVTPEQKEYFLEIYRQYQGKEFTREIKVIEPTIDELKGYYYTMTLDECRAIKKERYSNMGITSAMSNDEKALTAVIALKFSERNQEIKEKREAKKLAELQPLEVGQVIKGENCRLVVTQIKTQKSEPKESKLQTELKTKSKITISTLKSFIKKADKLFVLSLSSFDGMDDCVRYEKNPKIVPVSKEDAIGQKGVWCVGGSRDYLKYYETDTHFGIEVYNCCGTEILLTNK